MRRKAKVELAADRDDSDSTDPEVNRDLGPTFDEAGNLPDDVVRFVYSPDGVIPVHFLEALENDIADRL